MLIAQFLKAGLPRNCRVYRIITECTVFCIQVTRYTKILQTSVLDWWQILYVSINHFKAFYTTFYSYVGAILRIRFFKIFIYFTGIFRAVHVFVLKQREAYFSKESNLTFHMLLYTYFYFSFSFRELAPLDFSVRTFT